MNEMNEINEMNLHVNQNQYRLLIVNYNNKSNVGAFFGMCKFTEKVRLLLIEHLMI